MTRIENYINIAKRKGYNKMPPNISLCPSLRKRFEEYCHRTGLEYRPSHIDVPDLIPNYASPIIPNYAESKIPPHFLVQREIII